MKPCKRLERVLVTLSPSLTRGNTEGFQMATAKVALLSIRAQLSPTLPQPCLVQVKVHSSRNLWFWLQGRGPDEYAATRKQMILQRTETR